MSIPNFDPVSIEEVIDYADDLMGEVADGRRIGKALVAGWVAEENAARATAQREFATAAFDLAGVTVKPGDLVHLTLKPSYSGSKAKRSLNCIIVGRMITKTWSGRHLMVGVRAYGGKPTGWPERTQGIPIGNVIKVEPQDVVPEAVVLREKEIAEGKA